MSFCSYCGDEVNEDLTICKKCGSKIKNSDNIENFQNDETKSNGELKDLNSKFLIVSDINGKKPNFLIIGIILGVLTISVAVLSFGVTSAIFCINDTHQYNDEVNIKPTEGDPLNIYEENQVEKICTAWNTTGLKPIVESLKDKTHPDNKINQICNIWGYVMSQWLYVEDPNRDEYFSTPQKTIKYYYKGDCDDYAILMASMMDAMGQLSRIVLAHSDNGGHAYSEVFITNDPNELPYISSYILRYSKDYVRADPHKSVAPDGIYFSVDYDNKGKPRYWLNLDWWANYPGGKYYTDNGSVLVIYSDRSWERINHETISF